jgi:hypothetical protein
VSLTSVKTDTDFDALLNEHDSLRRSIGHRPAGAEADAGVESS